MRAVLALLVVWGSLTYTFASLPDDIVWVVEYECSGPVRVPYGEVRTAKTTEKEIFWSEMEADLYIRGVKKEGEGYRCAKFRKYEAKLVPISG